MNLVMPTPTTKTLFLGGVVDMKKKKLNILLYVYIAKWNCKLTQIDRLYISVKFMPFFEFVFIGVDFLFFHLPLHCDDALSLLENVLFSFLLLHEFLVPPVLREFPSFDRFIFTPGEKYAFLLVPLEFCYCIIVGFEYD